jgi:two-component system, OmpR family, sensor histidine kinase BaeS
VNTPVRPHTALELLHRRAIRVQLPAVLMLVPLVVALHAPWIASVAIDVALGAAPQSPQRATGLAVALALGIAVALTCVTTVAAALLLRGSIRAVVEQLHRATEAIATGSFAHRIASSRSDELGRLAGSIDVMAERLERLEQGRRRLLACVSHELRTPLTIIQGYAYTLARDEHDLVRRERLEQVQSEAMRLAALVTDLVDAACIHAGGLRIVTRRVDLVDVVRERVVRFADEAAARDVAIELLGRGHRVAADVDAARVAQVVDNLLANAVRHARPGTSVGVRVDAARRGERIVEVSNRCEPIPQDVVESIFEPFVQGAARTGSVGLGLSIASGIVVAHGGTISIDRVAAVGGTARFLVRLPAPGDGSPPAARSCIEGHAARVPGPVRLAGSES